MSYSFRAEKITGPEIIFQSAFEEITDLFGRTSGRDPRQIIPLFVKSWNGRLTSWKLFTSPGLIHTMMWNKLQIISYFLVQPSCQGQLTLFIHILVIFLFLIYHCLTNPPSAFRQLVSSWLCCSGRSTGPDASGLRRPPLPLASSLVLQAVTDLRLLLSFRIIHCVSFYFHRFHSNIVWSQLWSGL